ncbi:hypothetical protein POM88_000156 [Heracleum sosnowskyi]|uniref:Uncharacterized protein n=1 Tax=Heracleum sosnowskyi TaxID=360622 RepID=A0AAD8JB84_9APIA|nr:hypothetical protein POM88_000156 [Heracleum sosnowskyi]
MSHFVGDRFGTYLRLTIPLLKNYYISELENNEELRECILQAMESFLLVCSRDVSSYCEEILHLTLKFLSYDPDFDDNMEEDTEDEIYQEEEDEYRWSDGGFIPTPCKTELMHEDPYTKALKSFGALLPRNDQRLHDHEKSEEALIIKVHFS